MLFTLLNRYVENEMPNSGLLAPLHAFAIVKQYMPRNQALAFYLLEKIAQCDCTHPLVCLFSITFFLNYFGCTITQLLRIVHFRF